MESGYLAPGLSDGLLFFAGQEPPAVAPINPTANVGFYAPPAVEGVAFFAPLETPVVTPPIDPPVDPPGPIVYNKIIYTLKNRDLVPWVNLTNLDWALFKELKPSRLTVPVAKGTVAYTDDSAVLRISVDSRLAPVGAYFLVLTDEAGENTLASRVTVVP